MGEEMRIAIIGGGALILGAVISAGMLFLNNWFQRNLDRKKWRKERRKEAYITALSNLIFSRRMPIKYEQDKEGFLHPASNEAGIEYLEKGNFRGAMHHLLQVPLWLTMVENFSSQKSKKEIRPCNARISEIVPKLLLNDHTSRWTTDNKEMIEVEGMSQAVEEALQKVIECSNKELAE
jgi:hypothetical protein